MLLKGIGLAVFLIIIFPLGYSPTITIVSHNTTVFGVCPVTTLPYCYSGKHASFNQVNTSGELKFPNIPFSKVNLTKLDISMNAQFTGTQRFNVSKVNSYPTNLSFIGTYTEWSPKISNFKLLEENITLLIYPEILTSLNILSWKNNITLHITYYLINISTPSLSKDGNFLTCSSNITTDFTGADLSTNFTFSKNGEIMSNLTGSKTCINSTECQYSAETPSSSGNWTCEVFSGDWSVTSAVQRFNSPIEITTHPFQTDNSTSEHSFIARARAEDPDGLADISSCFVSSGLCGPTYLEPTGNENEAECRSTCSSQNESSIILSFVFSDSQGTNVSTNEIVFATPNSLPSISSANITLTSANATRKYAEFSCVSETIEPDEDFFTESYLFYSTGFGTLRVASQNHTFHCRESEFCLKGEEIKCEIRTVDQLGGVAYEYSEGAVEIANSPPEKVTFITPNGIAFNSSSVQIEFLKSTDEDGDTISYEFHLSGAINYSSPDSPLDISNLSDGNYTLSGRSTDGNLASSSEYLHFSILTTQVTTTTLPTSTTTTSISSGGGVGGLPPAPASTTSTVTTTIPPTHLPIIGAPIVSGNDSISITIENPSNSSVFLEYNKSVLSCSPEEIPPKTTLAISCTFKTNENLEIAQIGLAAGNATLTRFELGKNSKKYAERARTQVERLFGIWMACFDSKAKELVDSLQSAIDREKQLGGNKTELELLVNRAESYEPPVSCPRNNSAGSSGKEVNSSTNGRLPTPLFVAEPKTLPENENFFTKLLNAIIAFFSKIFLKIKSFFGFP